MKATTIAVEDSHEKLVRYATYCPPNMVITEEQFEIFFNSLGPWFIAGAVYNAKHRLQESRLETLQGRQ